MLHLGPFDIPVAPARVLLVGAPQSGKSAMMKAFKRSLMQHGATLYDLDNSDEAVDWYRYHAPRGLSIHPITMRYADGVGINYAGLIANPLLRELFAEKIFEDSGKESSRFFSDMAKIVFVAACEVLNKIAPGEAYLADMVRLAMWPELLNHLRKAARLDVVKTSVGSGDAKKDVTATVISRLAPLAAYAAMDMNAKPPRLNIPLESPGVLVMEWLLMHAPAVSGVFSFLIECVAAIEMSKQSTDIKMLMGDEFRLLGKRLNCLPTVAGQGRKFGLGLVLSAHTIGGVRHIYGRELAEEILGLCDYKVFLKSRCIETSKWASECLGEVEIREDVQSHEGKWSASYKSYRNVLPSEIRHGLKWPNAKKDVIEGYADFPDVVQKFNAKFMQSVTLKRAENRPLLSEGDLELPAMSLADMKRLGVSVNQDLFNIFEGKNGEG